MVAAPSAGSVSGACVVSATVTFGGGLAPLTATTSVELVGLSRLVLYAAPADAFEPPEPSRSSTAVALDTELVLLKCDGLIYDQVGVAGQAPLNGRRRPLVGRQNFVCRSTSAQWLAVAARKSCAVQQGTM